MVRPTFNQCWRATNDEWIISIGTPFYGQGVTWHEVPQENRIPAESSPFQPFYLGGNYTWLNSDEVELNADVSGQGGIIGLMVKPSFRVKIRLESNENNAFWGIEDVLPQATTAGGVISHGERGVTGAFQDDWVELALAKGDFIFISTEGDYDMIPEAINNLTKNLTHGQSSTMIGVTDFSVSEGGQKTATWSKIDDEVRIKLVEIQTVEGEEGMFFDPETVGQFESGTTDETTGETIKIADHVSGLETQVQLVHQQNNFKVEILGEPTLTSEDTWSYYWYVLVNGSRRDKAYEGQKEAREAAEEIWADRPPPEDKITPPSEMDWDGIIATVLILGAVGFGIWFTIKAVTRGGEGNE